MARPRRLKRQAVPGLAMMLVTAAVAARPARAQSALELRPVPVLRADAIIASHQTSLEVGGGAQFPAGYYVRVDVLGAAGEHAQGGVHDASGRLDVVGRFLLDPFRRTPFGLSAGAGLSLRARHGDRIRPYLLMVADLEGPRTAAGVSPALQLGLGGGVRIGLAFRWSGKAAR
ncbi:MAG: hypothetical protein ABJA80_01705 [bacterium]